MAQRIVILGAPGAGKGTQAQRLAERYGWPHISTGDIFRAHENKSAFGKKIEEYLKHGHLVPDDIAFQAVADRLSRPDCQRGYVLDGFPRSIPQAEELNRLLNKRGESLTAVIEMHVEDDEIVDRVTARRTCPVCGSIYNLKFQPPRRDEVCDNALCAEARLVQRDDDREATIRKRLRVYHKTTEPIIDFYRREGLLTTIDCVGKPADGVASDIDAVLEVAPEVTG